MQYVATIKDLPACTVYAKKLTAPDPSAYFSLIPAIGEQMCRQYPALKCAVPEYCFFVSLDSEYRDHDMHLEFCEAVETAFPDFEDIVFKTLEPVRAVTAMHKGPYETLSGAYAFLTKWVEENGYVMTQRPRESQIDGIWNQEDPANWLTEVQFPIAKQV